MGMRKLYRSGKKRRENIKVRQGKEKMKRSQDNCEVGKKFRRKGRGERWKGEREKKNEKNK
jgi:hypothetical protein